MNAAFEDCLVEDYEHLMPAILLPDEDDRHVLAAAIHGRADLIVTFNGKHFPAEELSKYGIEVRHPDEFIACLMDIDETAVYRAVKKQRETLKNPAGHSAGLARCAGKVAARANSPATA